MVGEAQLRHYLLYLIDEEQVSRSYLNQAISALKSFYDRVLNQSRVVGELPRPRRERKLPIVLSRSEVLHIFEAIRNPKHRALLMVAYSAGLRVSEVVRLKVEDIDSDRALIRVHQAKGRKDRYTALSRVALEVLRDYWRIYRPTDWLFPGAREGKHLTTSMDALGRMLVVIYTYRGQSIRLISVRVFIPQRLITPAPRLRALPFAQPFAFAQGSWGLKRSTVIAPAGYVVKSFNVIAKS